MTVRLVRHGRADYDGGAVRQILLDVYAEVYAEQIATDPFFSMEWFADRLENHVEGRRWEAVVGYDGDDPVGYGYGCSLSPGARWWSVVVDVSGAPLDEEYTYETGDRTLALFELMVRVRWRRTGTAHRIHEELLAGRSDQRVSLGNNAEHGRVRALYESWGYQKVGTSRPFPDAPLYNVLVRDLRGL